MANFRNRAVVPFAAGCLIAGGVGLLFGDGAIGAVSSLLAFHGPLALGSLSAATRIGVRARLDLPTWVRAGSIYFATSIGLGLILGAAGLWTRSAAFASVWVLGSLWLFWGRGRSARAPALRVDEGASSWVFLVLAIVVFWGLLRAVVLPRYEYDSLTYHLTFPAVWCQRHAVAMTPTWFGDPSPTYAPLGCEVYYAWLMLATNDDLLARCGQVPFWLLLLGSVSLLSRELRVSRTTRRIVCLVVALAPALTLQAGTAMVDVAVAAYVVAVVAFSLRLARRKRPEEAIGVVLFAGLLLTTKYLAMAFAAATLPVVTYGVVRAWPIGLGRRGAICIASALLLAGAVAMGWYGRNAVLTGNPVYPMEVRIGSTKVWEGAYGRAQMENSSFNLRRREGWTGLRTAAGRAMLGRDPEGRAGDPTIRAAWRRLADWMPVVAGALFLVAFARAALASHRGTLLVATTALLTLAVFWWGSPFQQPRFAWPALVLSAVTVAGAGGGRRTPGALRIAGGAAACLWGGTCLFGWWILGLGGAVVIGAAVVLALGATILRGTFRRPEWIVAASVLAPAMLWCVAAASADPRAASFASWPALGEAWAYVDEHVHGATIAYTGDNVPYFLLGRRLENRAIHVPACAPAAGAFHEYARSTAAVSLGPPNTSEPVPHRYEMRFTTWIGNLRAARADYVLVHSLDLFPNLLLNVRHDATGFPIERRWLDAMSRGTRPVATPLAFGRGAVLLYRLSWDGLLPDDVPEPASRNEAVDAVGQASLDRTPPGEPIRGYPHARAIIDRQGLRELRP